MAKKILVCVGTRPEAIKMAPVIRALKESCFESVTLFTGQHRELVKNVLEQFDCSWDYSLEDVMIPGQSLASLSSKLMHRLEETIELIQPDAVLAQGDTTTVMITAMVCFYKKIPFGHVEAGLRTNNIHSPFPEEYNRRIASLTARWHFCPTVGAAENLRKEGVSAKNIFTTGNTVIDALLYVKEIVLAEGMSSERKRKILLTCHRRENFGISLDNIFSAVKEICEAFPDVHVVYPVHPNPQVHQPALKILGNHPQITLREPLGYADLVKEMLSADLILTDSGGIQEEAPALGKPVVVLRDETERPEAVKAGAAILVGTDKNKIISVVSRFLLDSDYATSFKKPKFPYGRGDSAQQISSILESSLIA